MVNTNIVTLRLRKPFYEKWLRYTFLENETGKISITRENVHGKYLYSRVRYADIPQVVKQQQGIAVELLMPAVKTDCSKYHFPYFTVDDTVRINDYIESSLYLDYRLMLQVAIHDLHINRKIAIAIFSDVMMGEEKMEMLKKDDYRRRQKTKKLLIDSIKVLGY